MDLPVDPDAPAWDDPDYCPFCGTRLTSGGAGFIDHLEASPDCETRFAEWLEHVRDDIGGEWGG
ncbi:DUF7501 family protein [Halorarius halobius]|uniref:DUF7501 family protein n=1 Tax=Halorarius halobius TaxID=2962671 RepID=UPI0020CDF462|nr:hypothetical protein [Halorarius halobius]